jgi:hypothetical protein
MNFNDDIINNPNLVMILIDISKLKIILNNDNDDFINDFINKISINIIFYI